jgi:hypothetical protein
VLYRVLRRSDTRRFASKGDSYDAPFEA